MRQKILDGQPATRGYDAANRKVWVVDPQNTGEIAVDFFLPTGEKIGTYKTFIHSGHGQTPWPGAEQCNIGSNGQHYCISFRKDTEYTYFAGRLVKTQTSVTTWNWPDRLSSEGGKHPYGEGTAKFATYWQDGGLHYAVNRYYSSTYGRFTSPDPYRASGGPADPASWNRYAYVENDPVNFVDPQGLFRSGANLEATDTGWDAGSIFGGGGWGLGFQFETPRMWLISSDFGGGGGGGQEMSEEMTKEERSRKAALDLSCEKDVREAMKAAWAQSANGTTGVEAGFRIDGSASNYQIKASSYTNQQGMQTMTIATGQTFAIFHVHPNNSGPLPSTPATSRNRRGDTAVGDRFRIDMFVMSSRGLYVYDHSLKKTLELQTGLDWTKPCP